MQIEAEITEIKGQLQRIEQLLHGKFDRPTTVSIDEAMRITGHRSTSAFYRWTSAHSVKPCKPGQYLLKHVEHGLNVAALKYQSKAVKIGAPK